MSLKISILLLLLLGGLNNKNISGTSTQNSISKIDKKQLLFLVNEARSKGCNCGNQHMQPAGPVKWDDQLEDAAMKHSRDMDRNHFMRHDGSDGSSFSTRISKSGFKWTSCAENIADGYETEQEVVEGWLNSPMHCKNLMNPRYEYMGVARSGNYWTQDFGSK